MGDMRDMRHENSFEILGTQVKTCLKCTETPVKLLKFWQSGRAASAGALAPEPPRATRSTPEYRALCFHLHTYTS